MSRFDCRACKGSYRVTNWKSRPGMCARCTIQWKLAKQRQAATRRKYRGY